MNDEQQELSNEERAWRATPDMVVLAIEKQAREFYSEERLERAGELVEKLVKMRPKNSQYWALLGVIHRRRDQLVPALQYLQEASELDPSNRNALVNLGECLVIAGQVVEGADILRAVFDMGYQEGKPPAEHDVFTKRAGAQLAILQKVVEGVEAGDFDEVQR